MKTTNNDIMTSAIVKKKTSLFLLICLVPEVCVQFCYLFSSSNFSVLTCIMPLRNSWHSLEEKCISWEIYSLFASCKKFTKFPFNRSTSRYICGDGTVNSPVDFILFMPPSKTQTRGKFTFTRWAANYRRKESELSLLFNLMHLTEASI